MWRATIFFLLLVTCSPPGWGQGQSTLLTVNDGLSQGMVFDILQSRDGFLWIATKDGLNRYDGYRFEVFTNDPFDPFSIVSNEIWRIFEDSRGWLWLASPEGLDVFMPATGRFFHILSESMPGIDGYRVSFVEMPDGDLWIAINGKCWEIGVPPGQLENASRAGHTHPGLPTKEIELPGGRFSTVFRTAEGRLLFGTTLGFYELEPSTYTLHARGLSGQPVRIFGQDQRGRVWIDAIAPNLAGLELEEDCGGLWLWDEKTGSLRSIPCFPYGRHQFAPDGSLWTWRSMDRTFNKWDPEEFARGGTRELALTCDHEVSRNVAFYIRNVSFDRTGIVWLGTNGYGLLKLDPAPRKFAAYLPGTTQRLVSEDPEGRLIILGFRQRLYTSPRFDHAITNPWATPFDPVDDRSVTVFDERGNAWINCSRDSLFRIDARTGERRYLPWEGLGLIRSRDGKLLSVGADGLIRFDPVTEESRLFPFDRPPESPLTFQYSHFLYEDPTGTVWIFAFGGLIEAIPSGDGYRYRYYRNDPASTRSLAEDRVLSVAADPLEPRRYLWVGTKGGGLNRLDRSNGTFTHFKTEQGLPNNVVYGLLPDDNGHLWLSTNRGLCRFHVREHATRNFTAADGLQSNEFNQSSYLRTRDGHLIFGGVNGLTVFHPDSLRFNEHRPTTAITRVWANNQLTGLRPKAEDGKNTPQLEMTDRRTLRLDLTHRQNLISLEFAALDFSNPARNQYRYQLVRTGTFTRDEADAWVELGNNNRVQFANLRPGAYTFRVSGSNNDGAWSQRPAVLGFVIHPPWWATWWAYLLYGLALGGAVWRLNQSLLRRRLELRENQRLRELDEFKNRFFTNITHEFRTPLTVILGVGQQLLERSEQWVVSGAREDVKRRIGLIKRNGDNLLRLINQILDLAKLESRSLKIQYAQGDVLPYLRYITDSLHSLANARGVLLRTESSEPAIVMDYDPERLQQIVYNLLANAIKFTSSGGEVRLRAAVVPFRQQRGLQLSVADTGMGIPPADLPLIFDRYYQVDRAQTINLGGTGIGLALTRELVHALSGTIRVESEPGKGTTFTILLPISNEAEPVSPGLPDKTPEAAPADGLASPPGRPAPGDFPLVLIIEDHFDVAEYLRDCLGTHYQLDFAADGREGIEKALATVPDLIVSDVMMPEKDGFEVCERLKNDLRTSHIPIVLLTAKAGVENRIAGRRRGADAYLAKPFHAEELRATLDNLIELRRKLQQWLSRSALEAGDQERPELDAETAFLRNVRNLILEHLADATFNVDALSHSLGLSRRQLHRKLVALTGTPPSYFIRDLRLSKAKELLLTGKMNVSEVAYATGFDDPKYFSRVFSSTFGVPPSKL